MLGSFRKFSNSIYAKIVLGIVVIPFVFWGMGSVFTGGNQNIVVKIDKDKYSVEEFNSYIKRANAGNTKIDKKKIDELLSTFIGDKLINKEVERYGITISDKSLSQLIYNQEEFKRDIS